jgi:hypothetical protein
LRGTPACENTKAGGSLLGIFHFFNHNPKLEGKPFINVKGHCRAGGRRLRAGILLSPILLVSLLVLRTGFFQLQ